METKTVLAVGAGIGLGILIALIAFISIQITQTIPHEIKAAECTADPSQSVIILPEPDYTGLSVEEAIANRRSVRNYTEEKLSLEELSQILWAAQGITDESGKRTAPSAGALYPIELYVVPNKVEGVRCGIYHYVPEEHKLALFMEGNFTDAVYSAALGQEHVRDAAAVIVFTAVHERTALKYGDSADRYIAMEAGHISENILLESTSLGLGSVPVGAFDQEGFDGLLGINGTGESVLYLNCIGKTTEQT